MDFSFTQDQEDLRRHARDLLESACPPDYVERCDREGHAPREAFDKVAEQGWLGLIVPSEYGGAGGSAVDLAILLEEIGRQSEELAMWVFRTMTYGGYAIMAHGSETLKQRFLPKIAKGELTYCFGLTEPESGSDAAALTTRAERKSVV